MEDKLLTVTGQQAFVSVHVADTKQQNRLHQYAQLAPHDVTGAITDIKSEYGKSNLQIVKYVGRLFIFAFM